MKLTLPDPEKNIVIVSGPAGSGKDSLLAEVLKLPHFTQVITTTSREKRVNEREGQEYYFLSPEVFSQKIKNGEFLEYSQNENGAFYGVQKKHFEEALTQGKKLLWKLDWKGVQNAKKIFPGVKSIGILASPDSLAKRLRGREGTLYTETYFKERADYAKNYFQHREAYDYVIHNEDGTFSQSVQKFKEALKEITGA